MSDDESVLSNDIVTTDESTDSSEFSDSDTDDQEFKMSPLSTMIVYGTSTSGKTAFIQDMILSRAFSSEFKYVYLVVGGIKSSQDLAAKVTDYIKVIKDSFPEVLARNIRIFANIELFEHHLTGISGDELISQKLAILDDIMTSFRKPELVDNIINQYAHHKNFNLIITTQRSFHQDGKSLKDSARYIVLFPTIPVTSRNRLIRDYSPVVRAVINNFFSGQNADRVMRAMNTKYYEPVIIDTKASENDSDVLIYRGLLDSEPEKIKNFDKDETINPDAELGDLVEQLFQPKRHSVESCGDSSEHKRFRAE